MIVTETLQIDYSNLTQSAKKIWPKHKADKMLQYTLAITFKTDQGFPINTTFEDNLDRDIADYI